MRPRVALSLSRQTVGGAALVAAIVLGAVLARHYRRTHSCPVSALTPRVTATGPASSPANEEDIADEAWESLGSAFGDGDFGLFAMNAIQPVQVDGLLEPGEWSESFETRPLDPSRPELASRPAVRCLWDAEHIWISIHAAAPEAEATSQPSRSYCQLVLAGSDPAVRYRFRVDLHGNRGARRLAFDEACDIPPDSWTAAVQHSTAGVFAEAAIRRQALECERFTSGRKLPLIVRIGDGAADQSDSPLPSAYWLLDSLRGFRATLILLDEARQEASPARFANGFLDRNGYVLQWDWDRFIAHPGEPRELLVISNSAAKQISVSLASAALPVAQIDAASANRLRRYRVSTSPPAHCGLYKLAINSSVSLPLWVTSDPAKAARRYLLRCRADVENTVTDAWSRSVLLAHVARAFKSADASSQVAWPLVGSLAALQQAIQSVRRDEPPPLPPGVSKLMFNKGGQPAEFTIEVPAHYDPQLAWPVYWGQAGLPNMIGIQPVDLAGHMADWPNLERAVHIDPQRRYLCDWCGGAYVATDWLVDRPDLWAAAILAVRARWSPLIANACNVPILLWAYQPRSTPCLDALVTDTAAEWMRKQNCQITHTILSDYQHTPIPPERLPEAAAWLIGFRQKQRPPRVQCTMKGGNARSCYWAGIDCVKEPLALSELTAGIEADVVNVRTNDNVLGYTLRLDLAPVTPGVSVLKIIENGRLLGRTDVLRPGAVFHRDIACSQPAGDSRVVAQVSRPHPDWQWAQMAAEIVRARTGADMFFSPRMLRAPPAAAAGPIRVHDLLEWFHNDWIALARVDRATRRDLIPKLFAAIPQAVTAGLFDPAASSRPGETEVTVIATPADCDELNRGGTGVNPYRTAEGPACVAEYAVRCELTPVCVVDCLVAFLDEHPSLDLDAFLDGQQRTSKDRAEATRMLDKELGF